MRGAGAPGSCAESEGTDPPFPVFHSPVHRMLDAVGRRVADTAPGLPHAGSSGTPAGARRIVPGVASGAVR